VSYELGGPDDDRCLDEQREADMADREEAGCLRDYGVPFDPYAEEGEGDE
jgi:hypothetical protein